MLIQVWSFSTEVNFGQCNFYRQGSSWKMLKYSQLQISAIHIFKPFQIAVESVLSQAFIFVIFESEQIKRSLCHSTFFLPGSRGWRGFFWSRSPGTERIQTQYEYEVGRFSAELQTAGKRCPGWRIKNTVDTSLKMTWKLNVNTSVRSMCSNHCDHSINITWNAKKLCKNKNKIMLH